MSKFLKGVYEQGSIFIVVVGILILTSGISGLLHLSPILVSMTIGCFIVNLESRHNLFFKAQDPVEDLVFGLFFALAGAHMDLSLLKNSWHLALAVLLFRFLGKQLGVYLGSRGCTDCGLIKKYLGISLFPQAGVTIGLVMLSAPLFPGPLGELFINFMLGSVIINEIISPPLLKWTFSKAGEVRS